MSDESVFLKLFRGADEAMNPILDRAAERIATMVTDQKAVKAIIGRLNPSTLAMIKHVGPVAFGGAVGFFLPDSLFSSPAQANAVKNFVIRFSTRFADAFEKNGQALTADAVNSIVDELLNEEVIFDPQYSLIHLADCPLVHRGGNAKKGQQPRQQTNMIKLSTAIERGYGAAPCCHKWLEKKLEKPAAAPKAKGPIRSAFDAIDRLSSAEDKKLVLLWVSSLTKEQQERLSANLDSEAEVNVLLVCVKENMDADQILSLLENQSSRAAMLRDLTSVGKTVQGVAERAGTYVADKAGEAWDATKRTAGEVDSGLEPLAQTFEELEGRVKNRPAKKSFSVMGWLKNIVRI